MTSLLAFSLPGGPEWILIFLVVLLLFGAKKLPDLARGLARSLTEFRKAKDEFDQELASAKADTSLESPKQSVETTAASSGAQNPHPPVVHEPEVEHSTAGSQSESSDSKSQHS